MKKNILNNLFLLSCLSVLLLASCEKADKVTELGSSAPYIQFFGLGGVDAGFSGSVVSFPDPTADTAHVDDIKLQLSTSQVFGNDVQVTIAVDTALVNTYNNEAQPEDPYFVLPDSVYSLATTTVTIKAGSSISEPFSIEFYPNKIDGSLNYMMPVKIVSINGGSIPVAPSTGVAYFHLIGNPLAGNYDVTYHRYNYVGSVTWNGPPDAIPSGTSSTTNLTDVDFAVPLTSKMISLYFLNVPDPGTGGLAQYFISATDNTYSDITFDFAPTFNSGYTGIQKYVVSYTKPVRGVTPASFHLMTKYTNASGNDRIIDQTWVHQ
jgi:hypothetical protein